ncbi:MAG: TRAP transporter large permease subunit [Lachnospiraceae bacterium]|nr:TRAP transporter large permease subunit [Lachnospiraceae bacterium]
MISGGYRENSAAGLLACGGALGPVIPPSICMIVYGTTMGVSVPAIVLGGIYGGVFTPTEAAAVCVAFALILGICYRELNPASLMDSLIKTVETSSMVIIIVGMSAVLSWILSATGIPAQIASAATPFLGNKYVYIVVLLLILFGIGCLMETVASMLILGPILVPIGLALGMNDLHLAIVFSVALVVGMVTPPFGLNLFTACATSRQTFLQVVKGMVPYLIALIAAVILVAFVPELSLFLPRLMGLA